MTLLHVGAKTMYQVFIFILIVQQCFSIEFSVPDICKNRPSKGPCSSQIKSWYYNAILNKCKEFEYSGCGGNPNRFDTENECIDVCQHQSIEEKNFNITLSHELRLADEPDLCKLPKRLGNCTEDISSVYYDSEQKQCKTFSYTGCDGNKNRFEDMSQCNLMCGSNAQSKKLIRLVDSTIVREVCTYQPIRGPCLGRIISWYYDTGSRRCRKFIYSGCGGNLNRFSNEIDCRQLCFPPRPTTKILDRRPEGVKVLCSQPVDEGNCTDAITMWYYDNWSRNCLPFRYTGCGGNDNRFRMQKHCLDMCAPPINKRNEVGKRKWKTKQRPKKAGLNILNKSRFSPKYDFCALPPKSGKCNENLPRFFYDPSSKGCKPFIYTGCSGNLNRFPTKLDCFKICHLAPRKSRRKPLRKMIGHAINGKPDTNLKMEQNICALPPSRGDCGGYELIWVFDIAHQQCRKFYYSGCGGNANQFRTKEYCVDTCHGPDFNTKKAVRTTSPPFCYMRPNPGRCSMKQTYYFHHPATRTCRKFLYGGCGGNPNRFERIEECEAQCLNIPTTGDFANMDTVVKKNCTKLT